MSDDKSHYEILDVAESATYVDIDAAYQRALDLIRGDSVGGYLMLDEDKMKEAIDEVEAAYAVLKDPDSRAAFDNERGIESVAHKHQPKPSSPSLHFLAPVFESPVESPVESSVDSPVEAPVDEDGGQEERELRFAAVDAEPPPKSASSPPFSILPPVDGEKEEAARDSTPPAQAPPAAAPASTVPREADDIHFAPTVIGPAEPTKPATSKTPALPADLADELGSGAEINGQLIRRLREARGLSIADVAKKTHIQKKFLVAIEEMDFSELPRRVYLRGFLTQIARVLRVDKKVLSTGYLAVLDRFEPGAS